MEKRPSGRTPPEAVIHGEWLSDLLLQGDRLIQLGCKKNSSNDIGAEETLDLKLETFISGVLICENKQGNHWLYLVCYMYEQVIDTGWPFNIGQDYRKRSIGTWWRRPLNDGDI